MGQNYLAFCQNEVCRLQNRIYVTYIKGCGIENQINTFKSIKKMGRIWLISRSFQEMSFKTKEI